MPGLTTENLVVPAATPVLENVIGTERKRVELALSDDTLFLLQSISDEQLLGELTSPTCIPLFSSMLLLNSILFE